MTDARLAADATNGDTTGAADLFARLTAHRTLGAAPRAGLEWLVAHGTVHQFAPGEMIARKGEPVESLYIILQGRVSHLTDQGGTWRKVMDWRDGDVTGQLPYSRLAKAPGNSVIDETADILCVPRVHVAAMPFECPNVTAALVHVMVDRVRAFKSSDLQVEKMASLGKLAAGLAHELNNPASAAARSAQLVSQSLTELEEASRALGAAHLAPNELALIDRVRGLCLAVPATSILSPLERSDREESIADWLAVHNTDESFAASLAETDVTLALLDELASTLSGEKLGVTLRWVAAGCTIRGLARDIERAASRVHALVSAVKGFTYMDHATSPEPVDVAKGLTDTLAVMAAKARGRSVSVTVDLPTDLPRVRGLGGELNQVWANLVDNALDAVGNGGRVTVTARAEGPKVVVRVADDGPGVPPELKNRIFDPFFTTKPIGKGTGLGLDIVRRLVHQNDGLIDVESVPGRTEFKVVLPAVMDERS
jgi:signal transduction histidine kinase